MEEIQISVDNLNSRFDRMDERLNSLGAQVTDIRRFVDLGVSAEKIHGDPFDLHHQKQPNHHPMHDLHFISFAFIISVLMLYCLHPLLTFF